MSVPLEVFCCYAREDQEMLEHLKKHLMPLQRQSQITVWSDTDLNAGVEWEKELHQHLESADIILLLISPDFIASDYCYSTEMNRAIERHEQGSTQVIPLLLRPVHWDSAPFAQLQVIPTNAEPVTKWSNRDDAFHDTAKHVNRVVTEIKIRRTLLEAGEHARAIRYQEALACYERVLHLDQTNGSALFGKARILYELGQIDTSIEAFTLAEQIAPTAGDNFFSQLFKGRVLNQRERYAESLAAYDRALSLDPNHANIYAERATILIKQKAYEQALSTFEYVRHLEPEKVEYITQTGELLFRLRRYEQALAMYERASTLQPGEASHHSWQGQILYHLQRYNEALAAYQQALTIAPRVEYYKMAGEMLLELARSREALTLYEQGIQAISEPHASLYEGKGQALFYLLRYEEALDCYQRAIKLNPSNTNQQLYHQLSLLYYRLARDASAKGRPMQSIVPRTARGLFLAPAPAFDPTKLTLLHTLDEHRSPVRGLATGTRSSRLASGSWKEGSSTIWLWAWNAGRKPDNLGYLDEVYGIAMNPEGEILASGSSDGTIRLWELSSGRVLLTLTGHTSYVHSLAFSSDGKILASGSSDQTIKLWELPSGRELRTFAGHTSDVYDIAISFDDKILASGSSDDTIRLWELSSGRVLLTLTGHTSTIHAIAISRDGKILASGSNDETIKLWELPSGRELRTLTGHTWTVNSLAISRDSKILASGSSDETIKLWELPAGRELRTLVGHTDDVNCVVFNSRGNILASGSNDETIKLWGMEP
jgi:tetratricopeptide (TPR) repeat protein